MEKQSIDILIAGKSYTLSSTDTVAHMRRVAALADRRLAELAAVHPGTHTDLLSMMAMLSFADELVKAQDDNTRLRRQVFRASSASGNPVQ